MICPILANAHKEFDFLTLNQNDIFETVRFSLDDGILEIRQGTDRVLVDGAKFNQLRNIIAYIILKNEEII